MLEIRGAMTIIEVCSVLDAKSVATIRVREDNAEIFEVAHETAIDFSRRCALMILGLISNAVNAGTLEVTSETAIDFSRRCVLSCLGLSWIDSYSLHCHRLHALLPGRFDYLRL